MVKATTIKPIKPLTSAEQKKIATDMTKCVKKLTDKCTTTDAIAEKLKRAHIKGYRESGDNCPIRNYLFPCIPWPKRIKKLADGEFYIYGDAIVLYPIYTADEEAISPLEIMIPTPVLVRDFIKEFDREMKFSFLEKK